MAWNTDRTKALLLSAAAKEFGQRGFAGARVDRIAMNAGVNKERIYQYFRNKEGLFEAVLGDMSRAVAAVPLQGSGAAAVGDYAGRLFDRYCEDEVLSRLQFWEGLEQGVPGQREGQMTRSWMPEVNALASALPGIEDDVVEELLLSMVTLCAGWRVIPRRDSTLGLNPEEHNAQRRESIVTMFSLLAQFIVAHSSTQSTGCT